MKILKYAGIITAVIAFVCGVGIVGRIETEDKEYRSGEISQEEMTTDEDLIKGGALCICAAAMGGVLWATGAYIEAGRIERKYKRYYIK